MRGRVSVGVLPVPAHISDGCALLGDGSESIQTASKDSDVTIGPSEDCGWKGIWGLSPSSPVVIWGQLMNPFLLSSWLTPQLRITCQKPDEKTQFITEVSM